MLSILFHSRHSWTFESSPGALICSSSDEVKSSYLRQFGRLGVETPATGSPQSTTRPCREVWLDVAGLSGNSIRLADCSVAEGPANCESIARSAKRKILIEDEANTGATKNPFSDFEVIIDSLTAESRDF